MLEALEAGRVIGELGGDALEDDVAVSLVSRARWTSPIPRWPMSCSMHEWPGILRDVKVMLPSLERAMTWQQIARRAEPDLWKSCAITSYENGRHGFDSRRLHHLGR